MDIGASAVVRRRARAAARAAARGWIQAREGPAQSRPVSSSQRSAPNLKMDPALLSDCGSTHPARSSPAGQQRHWCEDGTKLRDSSDSKCHSVYDSGCIDSGFLSGANLSSEHFVSEEIKSRHGSDTESDSPTKSVGSEFKSYVRLDSGVDVGLNEQFSSLSLNNDLNEPSSQCQDSSSSFTNINVPTTESTVLSSKPSDKPCLSPAPWELYYQQDDDGDT